MINLKLVMTPVGPMLAHIHPEAPKMANQHGRERDWFIGWLRREQHWDPYKKEMHATGRCPICGEALPTEPELLQEYDRLEAENHHDMDYWIL